MCVFAAEAGVTIAEHTYSAVGNYTIVIEASNVLGDLTMTYDIYVQKPVTPSMFSLTTNAPVVFPGERLTRKESALLARLLARSIYWHASIGSL